MSALPLIGYKVIEIGTMLAAPFASHILSQLGAEIIKLESPAGDPTRALVRGGPSGTLIAYSHGKKSICIDLSKEDGKNALKILLKSANILIHNLAPKAARKLGVTHAECIKINPELIYCHIRGYAEGPQADDLASNPVAEASTGVMEENRINGRPSRLGPSYHDQFAGTYAVIGILSALMQKQSNNFNNKPIEIGLYETGLHVASRDLVGVQLKTHLLGRPEREPHGEFSMPGYGAYQTADERWLYLLMLTDGHWLKFCQALDLPQANDTSFYKLRDRRKAREFIEDIVVKAIGSFNFDDITKRFNEHGVGCTEVLPLERVLDVEQARWPGKLRDVNYRGLQFDVPEFPAFTKEKTKLGTLPPPELGEHTIELLLNAGLTQAECDVLIEQKTVYVPGISSFPWAPVRK